MVSNRELSKFVDIMVADILSKLEGTHQLFDRVELPDKPSKIIVLGTLGDKSTDYSIQTVNQERTLSSVKNNSLAVKFLTDAEDEKIGVIPSFSIYYRVYPTFQEQKKYVEKNYEQLPEKVEIARIWKRKDIELKEIIFNISEKQHEEEINFADIIQSILDDKNIFTGMKEINSKSIKDEKTYLDALKTNRKPSFDWKAKIQTKKEIFSQDGEQLKLITVYFINDTEENNSYETFLFNCHLKINLYGTNIRQFKHKYEYEGFEYHYETPLRCLNCHANYNEQDRTISTKHYSIFSQKKLVPRTTINGIKFSFEDLAKDDDLKSLFKLKELIEERINLWKKDIAYSNDPEYKKNLDHLEELKNRFEEGVEVLKTNKKALKAFQLLNTTFEKASEYEGWRIFQIFFIVSLIPDIIDKTKRREICEVLHVDTGGGKSEAYFGCVIFSAFWDRLTGKELGTTAIAKFPLRMLSVQQLQRIANLMIWAEEIRENEGIEGEPFSVAYFVGSSKDFPRHTREIIKEIEVSKKKRKELKGKIIEKCPLCNGDVILDFKENERYIVHRCKNCNKEFLLFYTDEEIYRFLPTFIVSTVDKLAGIATNRRLKNVFGGKIDKCPKGHGFIPHNDKCEVETDEGKCNKTGNLYKRDFETAPTLVIQDEMHLIREGFGTINSHFESLLETLQKELSGYGFKNIAMTATMTGAQEQIKHLYNKEIDVFPGNSVKERGVDDIFFEYELDDNRKPIEQRKIVGLKPNMRDNQFSSLMTLKYLSEFINSVESDPLSFSEKYGFDSNLLKKWLELYKTPLTYHNKKSDVHSMNYYLEAVVNSKLEEYKIEPKVLTGDSVLDDIKELIHLVETYSSKPENKKRLLSVFATSIVSHGVDINKWNFMIFQGMPRSTAEYIQALSRVGREYIGVVFVWFYPNRARDLSYYQEFEEYHRILPHKVENIPLSRWAKLGLQQTITSIFNAAILNYFSDVIDKPLYRVQDVNEVFSFQNNRARLIDFVQKAYVTDSKMLGSSYFKDRIPDEVEKRLNYLSGYSGSEQQFFPNALRDCEDKYFRTQYGMRGIQDEVCLKPHYSDEHVYMNISRR